MNLLSNGRKTGIMLELMTIKEHASYHMKKCYEKGGMTY